jgi:hypothetical protein
MDWVIRQSMQQKRSSGFAHHFRPTYAQANVGHPSIPSNNAVRREMWMRHFLRHL